MKVVSSAKRYLIIIAFGFFCVFLTLNWHSRSGRFNYHSEIWADKAGYYIYNPALFHYNFEADEMPDSIDIMTGGGFVLTNSNKIITKYTYGVALLQLPFYLLAEGYTIIASNELDPFSLIHHKAIDLAAVFYLMVGCWFLAKFLKFYVDELHAYLSLLVVFLGTNLYYYAICDTGMSHIYSFSLFAYFLYFIKYNDFQFNSVSIIIKLGLVMGLIVLIRPVNILFFSTALFLDSSSFEESKLRLLSFLNVRKAFILFFTFFIVFFPQFLYWKYSSGSFLNYSYRNEGFNWLSPHLLESWFSTNNGLFLYNPVYFILLLSIGYLAVKRNFNYVFIAGLFLLVSYVYSCWWDWAFGCSFGNRNFVEYTAILILPLAVTLNNYLSRSKAVLVYSILLLFSISSLMMVYHYDVCYFGFGNSDWSFYLNLLKL
jgi:hypothetical protein